MNSRVPVLHRIKVRLGGTVRILFEAYDLAPFVEETKPNSGFDGNKPSFNLFIVVADSILEEMRRHVVLE
jgi:hypothetical protein